jgi:hypothetical protein
MKEPLIYKMNTQNLLEVLLILASALVLAATTLLIWIAILCLEIKELLRSLNPGRYRDSNGRVLRERL